MRIHWLQHVPFEDLGTIEAWALAGGHALSCTRLYAAEPLPDPAQFELLVIMGGPMGVNDLDAHPWLAAERALIARAADAGRAVLGICLGAQLIAAALGAAVRRNPEPEIGWFALERTPDAAGSAFGPALPQHLTAFHWHHDTFELPRGAVRLARSAACANQAFAVGARILGVQFHPEATPQGVAALVAACGRRLPERAYVQRPPALLGAPALYAAGQALLHVWLGELTAGVESTR